MNTNTPVRTLYWRAMARVTRRALSRAESVKSGCQECIRDDDALLREAVRLANRLARMD